MRTTQLFTTTLAALVLIAAPAGCSKKDKAETESPEGEASGDPVAQLQGFQTQLTAEIDAVMKPITDAKALINDIGSMPDRLGVTMADLKGMFEASFNNGTVEVKADLKITAEAKAELEAVLTKAKEIGAGLKALPETVKTATANILEIGVKATGVATKATATISAKLKNPMIKADAKVELEGQLTAVADLKASIETSVNDAKSSVMELPAKGTEISAKLLASFSGSAG
jgi:acetylornithine deacetylase/succinyl-diaminopimelate desuccinylase-like protein